jgi:hypothetical protein
MTHDADDSPDGGVHRWAVPPSRATWRRRRTLTWYARRRASSRAPSGTSSRLMRRGHGRAPAPLSRWRRCSRASSGCSSPSTGLGGWTGCRCRRNRPRRTRPRDARRLVPARAQMDAVLLAPVSAAFFGAMPVAVRFALGLPLVPAAVGALFMQVATFAVLRVPPSCRARHPSRASRPSFRAGAIAPTVQRLINGDPRGGPHGCRSRSGPPLFAVTIAAPGARRAARCRSPRRPCSRRRRDRPRARAERPRHVRRLASRRLCSALRRPPFATMSAPSFTGRPVVTAGAAMLAASLL